MNVGSLFSGIGGIELGFERAGFRTEWFVENDGYCQEILRKRFPNTQIYGDITKIDFRKLPKVDVLTGGFPCQDISNAGKRAGIKGSRSSLWTHYARAIGAIRPRFVFIENVSALLGRGMVVVLEDLAALRYDAEWHCVSASAVGALHQRDRVFIIAYRNTNRNGKSALSINAKASGLQNDVADTTSERKMPVQQRGRRDGIESCCENVANSNSKMLEGKYEGKQRSRKPKETSGWRGQWATEPHVGRVAHGVPNRIHRIKCLGNAVVPQVAQVFAEAIKEEVMKNEWR